MMEEQEENATPWYKSLGKGINLILGILVSLVTIIAGVYTIKSLSEPTVSLTATYQESQFSFPERLSNTDYIDSILTARDRLITQLREQLRKRISDKEWLSIPDSLRFRLPEPFLTREPLDGFVGEHRFFYTLSIKNEGDKPINGIHIIHGSEAYFEFRDSRGVLRRGESARKLDIGDLAATEVSEVRLWSSAELVHDEKNLIISFSNGKVQASPVTLQGVPMVRVEPVSSLLGRNFKYLLLVGATIILVVKMLELISARRN
jgi:hypothetical protein